MHPAILLIGLITALGCFGPLAAPANAQQFPAKLVKFVVPQTPGGATDVFARKIGQILSEQWVKPIVIENRAGAGGVVGTDVVAKSPPDGYTLLVTYAGSQAILCEPLSQDSLRHDQGFSNCCNARRPRSIISEAMAGTVPSQAAGLRDRRWRRS
jgi:tripartite-type tricarboxylate transporter receptor subunit TctC